jgi:hypothetical protein
MSNIWLLQAAVVGQPELAGAAVVVAVLEGI